VALRYVALGDSYTIGTGVRPPERWPDQLCVTLGDEPGLDLVANLGVNGYTSADLIRHELPALEALAPEFASVLIGVNDVVQGVPTATYEANVAVILDTLLERLAADRLIAVAIPDYTVTPAGAEFGDPRQRHAAIVAANAGMAFGLWVEPERVALDDALQAVLQRLHGHFFFAQGGLAGPIMTFTGLWGPPFLKARFAIPSTTAAAVCSVMIVCWAGASPIFGALSDKIGRRKPLYVAGCLVAAAGWATMFYVTVLPLAAFVAVAALTSAASGSVILGFAYGKESVPVQYLGTVSGAINIGNMIGPTLLQPGIGRILEQNWTGAMANGARVYGVEAFQAAFLLSVGWTLLSCVLSSFTTDTSCKQRG
jgi:lysophospholipase L1-like esterase